jgi:hypothetical protein
MSLATSPTRSNRSRFKRTALVLSAGLFATTLAIGGGLAASAAPATLSASTATANGHVTITVDGFAPNESLTFDLDSTVLDNKLADGTGAFTGALYIPEDATVGTHTINILGTVSPAQSATINIVAQPTVSPAAPTITVSAWGTTGVTAAFSGFTPGESVQLGYATEGFGNGFGAPVTMDASGVVSATLRSSDIGTEAAAPGKYFLFASNVAGNIVAQVANITVVADPAAPATPVKARANFAG